MLKSKCTVRTNHIQVQTSDSLVSLLRGSWAHLHGQALRSSDLASSVPPLPVLVWQTVLLVTPILPGIWVHRYNLGQHGFSSPVPPRSALMYLLLWKGHQQPKPALCPHCPGILAFFPQDSTSDHAEHIVYPS